MGNQNYDKAVQVIKTAILRYLHDKDILQAGPDDGGRKAQRSDPYH